ncbi:type II toxin-antitoxin system RelE/ParE family toxin [Patescibacteria group bacterium]|nr:type II toxin-antitoxin system RelE/ParE family toxin [Patescibacteria group bacterium]
MHVIFTPGAKRDLSKLHKISQILILEKLKKLETGAPTTSVEKLVGYKSVFRIRLGNYRVVYRKIGGKIYIVLIGHKKDIYEKLKRLIS